MQPGCGSSAAAITALHLRFETLHRPVRRLQFTVILLGATEAHFDLHTRPSPF